MHRKAVHSENLRKEDEGYFRESEERLARNKESYPIAEKQWLLPI